MLNLILIRGGYPPAVVSSKRRREYLRALARADVGDAGALGELIARAVLDGLYRFALPARGRGGDLAPLAAFADERINVSALRNAALRGRLQATKGPNGLWRSTRTWVDEYLETRYHRGREG